jgi:hypothetical protein
MKFQYLLVAVISSGILKANQKQGVTFNSNKLGVIEFTKFSKMTKVQGLRSKFIKVVIDPLFLGKIFIKGSFFISKLKEI